jgi:hypothetical protein
MRRNGLRWIILGVTEFKYKCNRSVFRRENHKLLIRIKMMDYSIYMAKANEILLLFFAEQIIN